MKEPIQLLTTLNETYLPQLRVLLTSIHWNNPGESFLLYLIHRTIPEAELVRLGEQCAALNMTLCPVRVDSGLFANAPITRQYPQEMYYRLLAAQLLPDTLDRILYLDPDTLVINPLRPLWELDMEGRLFAAAAHTGKTEIANNVNRIRLKTENKYYNSGVLLIDLAAGREEIHPEEVFRYAEEHPNSLLLPDQDILNILYGARTLELDDYIWNYDARNFTSYVFRSAGQADMDWVMAHTVILHFCGKAKPWKPRYRHRFGVLYKHYMRLASRTCFPQPGKEDQL